MESQIRLYVESKMRAEHNFIYDDIEAYLTAKSQTSTFIDNFQYIKHALTLTIKVNLSQLNLFINPTWSIDYCSITNYQYRRPPLVSSYDKKYFYFVTSKRWISQECIELTLLMDTINTFKFQEDFTCDARTLITRQHKDRFLTRQYTFDDSSKGLSRNIDLLSENINAPLYKISESQLNDAGRSSQNFILYYKNKDAIDPSNLTQVNPVECYLTLSSSNPDKVHADIIGGNSIQIASLPNNGTYYINANNNVSGSILFNVNGTLREVKHTASGDNVIAIIKTSTEATIYYLYCEQSGLDYDVNIIDSMTISLGSAVQFEFRNADEIYGHYVSGTSTSFDYFEATSSSDDYEFTYSESSGDYVTTIDYIDRTDARNIKIINLPYSPSEYSVTSAGGTYTYTFSSEWKYDSSNRALKLANLNTKFERRVNTNVVSPFSNLFIYYNYSVNPTEMNRDITFESKLFHSDYYQAKFVYDSFSKVFLLETMDPFGYYNAYRTAHSLSFPLLQNFEFRFHMTRNIVSKFAYSFWLYVQTVKTQDYDNIVCVARNNEEVLYNSQYINYLRTGYNYDLKSKERQEAYGAAGLGLSVAGTIAGVVGSLVAGTLAQNPALGIVGAVASGISGSISIANASMNYAKSVAQSEQNIQEKLAQARNQAVSVLNADDVDLLQVYSNNKAKMCIYEVSETMKNALFDMFYYTGYVENKRAIPNVNTRVNFNYLACELFIVHEDNINDAIMEDIKAKYKDGVTFFHNSASNTHFYDYDQVKENWETWLYLEEE